MMMRCGVSEIDITPAPGIDLSGYAARVQPSIGVLDPLFGKCIYLENREQRLIWVGADLLTFDNTSVRELRRSIHEELGISPHQVLLSATHTHSAPPTIGLVNCGRVQQEYLEQLRVRLRDLARAAVAAAEPCEMVWAQSGLDLAVDRRGKPSAHIDPVATGIGFRRQGGPFIAAAINYAMHPVALGPGNRMISGDWCGYAAAALSERLPGQPVVLVSNGAAGNLNPPAQNVPPAQVRQYGEAVAAAVLDPLLAAQPAEASVAAARETVALPLEALTPEQIDSYTAQTILPNFDEALAAWSRHRKDELASGHGAAADIELQVLHFGPLILVAVTGEMFSRFTEHLREMANKPLFTVGYANGAFGYIPTTAAYEEGGYEVNVAHVFYNSFRARRGGLELLRDRAVELIRSIGHRTENV